MPEDTEVNDAGDAVPEKKRRGRPPKANKAAAKPAEKRKPEPEAEDEEDAPAPPVKRGRGRPPKAGGPAKTKPKGTGRRGRPPKKAAAKKAAEAEEEGSE